MKAGWEVKRLGEIYDVRDGTHDSPKYQAIGYPLITSKNLKREGLSFENIQFISDIDYKKINVRSAVHKGDVLFAMIGTIGNPTEVKIEPSFAIKNVALFKIPSEQSGSFLRHYLDSEEVISKMMKEARGTTQKFVGLGYLRNFPIKVPYLTEQQRIVAILDQAFEGIAKARANAEQNLKNARALFESHLQSVFTQRGDGWTEKRFDQVCVLQRGFDLPTQSRTQGKYPLVTSNGITDTHHEAKVQGPGVVTGRSGSIGNVFFVEDDFWPLNTALYIKNFHGNDPKFIHIFLQYFDLKRFATGTGVPTLNRNFVHSEKIVTPDSIKEQKAIVKKIDALLKETQRLQAVYQRKIALLDELKKSLLQQAFAGKL